jgi:hypothetical protein
MSVKINLKDVGGNDYEALPADSYEAKVTAGLMRETSGNGKLPAGTPMINWEFVITEPQKYAGRKIWTNTVIHENTMFTLKQLLQATGNFDDDQLAGELEFDIEDVVGSDVILVVTQREYNGNTVNDVKKIKSAGSSSGGRSSLLP